MILVTTAGKVGSAAAGFLAQQGQQVRVLVRDRTKVAALEQAGVEVAVGDLSDPSTIDAALRGVSAVVLVSPAVPALELNVIDSSQRAGVGHIVKVTSKAALDSPIARRRGQAEIERGLLASGLSWTLLRNNAYMQNFLMLAPAIAGTDSFGSSTGAGRVGLVDARDVGEVAATIAASPAAHASKTYWPTGPEGLTYAEVAGVLSRVLGRPITFRDLTFEQEKQGMLAAGLPEAVAEANARALALFAQGDSDWVTDDVPTLLGRPARSFEQFSTDYAAAFS
jgi:uncharacterized protein YbjT (DUF2867 family)